MSGRIHVSNAIPALLLGLLIWGVSGVDIQAQTQMKNRDFLHLGDPEPYLNYGRTMFEPYPDVLTSRNQYDRLGNFLMRGYNMFRLDDVRPGFSQVSRHRLYAQWFNSMIITSDTYRGWNYSLTVGDEIRTKLSDMTVKHPRWDGIRIDGAASDNQFTLMFTRGEQTASLPKFSTFESGRERSSVVAFGGHWQTELGDILQLGATYYNQHMADSFNSDGSFLKGDTPYSILPPNFITVAIEDDSPEEELQGARVYRVDIFVVGESGADEVRITTAENADRERWTIRPDLALAVEGGRRTVGEEGWQVVGNDRILFQFQMPEFVLPGAEDYAANPDVTLGGITIKSVRFQVDIEGDYRIGVRQKHLFFDQKAYNKNIDKGYSPIAESERSRERYVNPFTGLKGADGGDDETDDDAALLTPVEAAAEGYDVFRRWPVPPDPMVNPFQQYKWDQDADDIFYTVKRAKGRNRGRGVVEFDYGIPSGQAIYGLDWKLKLKDMTLKGELVTNPQHFIFPVGRNAGDRSSKRTWAYYLTLDRKLGPSLQLGGEIFDFDPDFSGNYDSRRGGIPFFTDRARSGGNVSVMEEFRLMADNDDNDQFPDDSLPESPSSFLTDAGIFPGRDENGDLVPDSDQNFNGIPDWKEPILFYDSNPPEFVYGIDLNNNGMVDYRENDDQPDYPYRRDRRGVHLFAAKDELGILGRWASLGAYRIKENAGGNEASAFYLRWEYYKASPIFGSIRINDDIKLVKDQIRDDVYIWKDYPFDVEVPHPRIDGDEIRQIDLNSQLFPPQVDPLRMKNSLVNTLFFESRFSQILDLNIVNNLQYVRNSQREDEFDDGSMQESDVRTIWTLVNKADYTLRLGDSFKLRPMFKHLLFRETSGNRERETEEITGEKMAYRSTSVYTPIMRADYHFTPKFFMQVGFQGFPFWRYRFKDRVNEENDFKQWDLVVMMTNRSDYWGYSIASQFGYARTNRKYDEEGQEALNERNSRIFFDLIGGY